MLPRAVHRPALSALRSGPSHVLKRHQQGVRRSLASLPRIADRSVWESIIPKAFKQRKANAGHARATKSREWNPATFYIVIFMIIGSNAINMIAMRTAAQNFSRKTEARIALLKNAIERVQRGEDVDVKKLLGTGDESEELEWEEAMREIENAIRNSVPRDTKPGQEPEVETTPTKHVEASTPTAKSTSESSSSPPASTDARPRFF